MSSRRYPYKYNASIRILPDPDATVAEVMLGGTNEVGDIFLPTIVTGASKRERGDRYDALVGNDLALARAFESLAARLRRRAHGRVRAQEHDREHAEAVREFRNLIERAGYPYTAAGIRLYQRDRDRTPHFTSEAITASVDYLRKLEDLPKPEVPDSTTQKRRRRILFGDIKDTPSL